MSERVEPPLIWRIGSPPKRTTTSRAKPRSCLHLAAQYAAFAADSTNLVELIEEVCAVAANGLDTEFAKLLIHDERSRDFFLAGGVGWRPGLIGNTRLGAGIDTAAGFAWTTGHSVISNGLETHDRFKIPDIMVEHGIVRSINVPIPGANGAIGVLEVESAQPGRFEADDLNYLILLARSFGMAHDRIAARTTETDPYGQGSEDLVGIRELHHRTNNDLHAVCLSIERERRAVDDPVHRAGYDRLDRQVIAIAKLHRHLRVDWSGQPVEMGAHLEVLCARIDAAFDLPSRRITLDVDIAPFELPPAHAGALALTITELVSNAVRHAFRPGGGGAIAVRGIVRHEVGVDLVELTVHDDGRGFAQATPGRSGLGLVRHFLRVAGAVLTRIEGPGTAWLVSLERPPSVVA